MKGSHEFTFTFIGERSERKIVPVCVYMRVVRSANILQYSVAACYLYTVHLYVKLVLVVESPIRTLRADLLRLRVVGLLKGPDPSSNFLSHSSFRCSHCRLFGTISTRMNVR